MTSVVPTQIQAAITFAATVAQLFPGAGQAVGMILKLEPAAMGLVSALMNMASENRGPTAAENAELDQIIAENSRKIEAAAKAAEAVIAAGGPGA